jgi:hypothetical protein
MRRSLPTLLALLAAKGNEVAQAVLHKSYSEFLAGFTELRREVRAEFYTASVQQP